MKPITERFLFRRRTLVMAVSLLLFLPPLALVFQATGDTGFCGSWCPRMFMVWRQGMTFGEFVGGIFRSWAGALLVAAVLAVTLFRSRLWCSHVCPVGGLLELGSRLIPRRLQLDLSVVPAAPFRYGYLLVFFAAPLLGIGNLCCSYCNFATVPRIAGAAFSHADVAFFLRSAGLVNLALVLLLGIFARGGRGYCNLLCPLGAIDAGVNRLPLPGGQRVTIDADTCTGCGDCRSVCPTWAISDETLPRVDGLSCIPCGRCAGVCGQNAIRYEDRRVTQ